MQIVNGYVCQTCSDVALAKKGEDPAHPSADPTKAGKTDKPGQTGQTNTSDASDPTSATQSSNASRPAVTFGGSLASVNSVPFAPPSNGSSSAPYSGGLVNLSA